MVTKFAEQGLSGGVAACTELIAKAAAVIDRIEMMFMRRLVARQGAMANHLPDCHNPLVSLSSRDRRSLSDRPLSGFELHFVNVANGSASAARCLATTIGYAAHRGRTIRPATPTTHVGQYQPLESVRSRVSLWFGSPRDGNVPRDAPRSPT